MKWMYVIVMEKENSTFSTMMQFFLEYKLAFTDLHI